MGREKISRKAVIVIALIIGTLLVYGVFWVNRVSNKCIQDTAFEKGYMDATESLFNDANILELNGEWEFYPNQLLAPHAIHKKKENTFTYIALPIELTELNPAYENSYGTLRGTIRIKDFDEAYALKIRYFSTSWKVFIDGKEMKEAGKVARTKENYKSHLVSEFVPVMPKSEQVEIVIQYANFHHRRVRLDSIYFGKIDAIDCMTIKGIIKDSVLFGILLVVGIFQLSFYVVSRKDKSFLFLGLISFLLSMRLGIVHERILIRIFPIISGEGLMKMGFFPSFMFPPLFVLYTISVFKVRNRKWLKICLNSYMTVITLIVILTTVKVYDPIFNNGFIFIIIFSIISEYIILKNSHGQTIEKNVIFASVIILTATGMHDFFREFAYSGQPELISYGFTIFIILQSFLLAMNANINQRRMERLVVENSEMMDKMSKMNDELEMRIEDRTKMLQKANQKLERLTNTDSLTGLNNRRAFDQEIKEIWEKASRERATVGVLIIDIDDFKHYNDFFGHFEGDECLKKISSTIADFSEKTNSFASRYGGEEFIMLYYGMNIVELKKQSEKLCKLIEKLKIRNSPQALFKYATISIGINNEVPNDTSELDTFLEKADKALYKAKKCGKNQVVTHI